MLALKAVSHDTFAAAQVSKTRPDLKFLNPLSYRYAVTAIDGGALIECDTIKEITR
jgi:hypothetical protein